MTTLVPEQDEALEELVSSEECEEAGSVMDLSKEDDFAIW